MAGILEISTCVGCYLNCSYCPQKLHVQRYYEIADYNPNKMTPSLFKKCLETVPKDVEIMFAGMAEPFLNPWAADMVLHAHEKGHAVSIYTTTVGLAPERVDRLRKIPFKSFCIHLPDAEGQMKLKPNEPYLAGLRACVDCIANRHYTCVGTVPEAVRAVIGDQLVNDDTKGLISRAGNLPHLAIPRKTGRLKALPCLRHSVLLPNGDCALCCCDYSLKSIIGNLEKTPYPQLFEGAEFKRVLRGLDDEQEDIICRNCEIAECA